MAWCLMAPSHYLDQWWLGINGGLWHLHRNCLRYQTLNWVKITSLRITTRSSLLCRIFLSKHKNLQIILGRNFIKKNQFCALHIVIILSAHDLVTYDGTRASVARNIPVLLKKFHGSSDICPMGFIYSIQNCEISHQTFGIIASEMSVMCDEYHKHWYSGFSTTKVHSSHSTFIEHGCHFLCIRSSRKQKWPLVRSWLSSRKKRYLLKNCYRIPPGNSQSRWK